MKNLLFSLLVFGSFNLLAQNVSDYERGYIEGKKACTKEELWVCETDCGPSDEYSKSATGSSRADALKKLMKAYSSKDGFNSYSCGDEVERGDFKCRQI